jgi:RNA polymerase primary sigma factor
MPRVAQYGSPAIGDLIRQLKYAPLETRRRQMDAAERLVEEVRPEVDYPEDYVIFRVTGYRSDRREEPLTFSGEALVADLVNFVQHLSQGSQLPPDYAGRRALALDALAGELRISPRTLGRYRKRGLICHYVVFADGTRRLACFEDSWQRFAASHQARVEAAATFSRLGEADRQSLIREAAQLRRREGVSLNGAARRLASDYRRAPETVRLLLRRYDRAATAPVFGEPGPLRDRDVRLVHRAWRRGVPAAEIARRFSKSRAAVHRAISRRRRDLLQALDLEFVSLPTFDLEDAASVILSAPAAAGNLDDILPHDDAPRLIAAAHAASPPDQGGEEALVAAYNYLKSRARRAIDGLGEWPRSRVLDAIETDLRWAAALKCRLVSLGFPPVLRTIERNLHRPLLQQPAEDILELVPLGVAVVARTVETLDPGRGERLERRGGFAMDRALATLDVARPAGRAAARHDPGALRLRGLFDGLSPWQPWLALRSDLAAHLAKLAGDMGRVVALRYGDGGSPPLTQHAIAQRLGLPLRSVNRLVLKGERELRRMASRSHGLTE